MLIVGKLAKNDGMSEPAVPGVLRLPGSAGPPSWVGLSEGENGSLQASKPSWRLKWVSARLGAVASSPPSMIILAGVGGTPAGQRRAITVKDVTVRPSRPPVPPRATDGTRLTVGVARYSLYGRMNGTLSS